MGTSPRQELGAIYVPQVKSLMTDWPKSYLTVVRFILKQVH